MNLENEEEVKKELNDDTRVEIKIIQDLCKKIENPDFVFYGPDTISLSSEIMSASPKAYTILCKYLPFPNESFVRRYQNRVLQDFPELLTDINMIKQVVTHYKTVCQIPKSEKIAACCAVDALYFTPEASISKSEEISGMTFSEKEMTEMPKNLVKNIIKKPILFEAFVSRYFKKVIKAAFVFQLQPFDQKYQNCVLHIKPTTDGKAYSDIVDVLKFIRKTLRDINIEVFSFAFDGDSAYTDLHNNYYNSYIFPTLSKREINPKTKVFRVVSDFLHIIKRLRYRILGSIVHASFKMSGIAIDISELKSVLDFLPSVVFNNEPFTKMHDKPPLVLFSTKSFIKLVNVKMFAAASYWFPVSISILAIDGKDISWCIRVFLLETVFWFLALYKECLDSEEPELNQRKRGEKKDVTFYTSALLTEFTNTIHCHIQFLRLFPSVNLDRNSTMPLEHKFGQARVRARDVHKLSRFIKNIAQFQTFENEVNKIDDNEKIPGRRSTFGTTINKEEVFNHDKEIMSDIQKHSPITIASTILKFADFNVNEFDEDELYWFVELIEDITRDDMERKSRKEVVTWSKTFLGVDGVSRSSRIIKSQGCSSIAKPK